jgi:oligopeptide transport system permease protein
MKLNLTTSGWIASDSWKTFSCPCDSDALFYAALPASILEVLRSDYVRTARAKGLSESVIIVKHVLKGALLPVVSYLGPAFAHIVTGSIVVETIFRVPGLGRHFVQSALNRDYTLIMGTVIVYSVILLVMNFIVDILYGFMDPRISYR